MHNVGKIDRYIRISLAVIIGILHFSDIITGNLDKILSTVAVVLAITSLRQCCPLYAILGLGTCGIASSESKIKIKTVKLNLKK